MAVVYSLETDGVIWYVGSTVDAKNRERRHRSKYAKGIGASLIPNEYEWNFKVLEECSKEQMRERERYWYERLNPFYNKCVPNRARAERDRKYREANPEAARERSRKYHEAHPEANREAMCKWREANPERYREAKRKYREANPEAYREAARKRNRRYWAKLKQLKESSKAREE